MSWWEKTWKSLLGGQQQQLLSDDSNDNDGGMNNDDEWEKKRLEYTELLKEQLSSFMRDPDTVMTRIERHEREYAQYMKYREVMLCRRLRCAWCRNDKLTLEEAFVEEPDNSHATVHHIRRRLRDGYSDRYIVDELEQLYGERNLRSFASWNVLQYVLKNRYWDQRL